MEPHPLIRRDGGKARAMPSLDRWLRVTAGASSPTRLPDSRKRPCANRELQGEIGAVRRATDGRVATTAHREDPGADRAAAVDEVFSNLPHFGDVVVVLHERPVRQHPVHLCVRVGGKYRLKLCDVHR
jgi:hypothetical protein